MAITFIPYVADPLNQRERGLNNSRARSHAAKIAHTKKERRLQQHARLSPVQGPARTQAWCFGRVESVPNTFGGKAVDLIRYCVRTIPTDLIISGELLRSLDAAPTLQRIIAPVLRDLFQRCVGDTGVFLSSVRTAVYVVVQDPQQRSSYAHIMDRSHEAALDLLRKQVDRPEGEITFNTKLAILNLCVSALIAGDVTSLGVHLQGLFAMSPSRPPQGKLESFIWYTIRTLGLCHAMMAAQAPLFPSSLIPVLDRWSLSDRSQEQPSSSGSWLPDPPSPPWELPIPDQPHGYIEESPPTPTSSTTSSASPSPQLSSSPTSSSISPPPSPHDHLPSWLSSAQLISPTVSHCISTSRTTAEFISTHLHSHQHHPAATGPLLNLISNHGSTTLHQLCSIYPHIPSLHPSPLPANVYIYDRPLLTALQLHLTLQLGGLLSTPTTARALCCRFQGDLRLAFTFAVATTCGGVEKCLVQTQRLECELWLALTGAWAARNLRHGLAEQQGQEKQYAWFRDEAVVRMRRLGVRTEGGVRLRCDAFGVGLGPGKVQGGFVEAALEVWR